MSRVLVTGGSGYFGSVLALRLHEQGHAVSIFDLVDASDRPGQMAFVQGDIRDSEAVDAACQGMACVYHCVAMVPLAMDAKQFWSVNKDGTKNLLDACLQAKVKKVINISSSAVFGVPSRNPVDDTVKPNPREDYGRAKLAAEDLCREYADRGLDVTTVRPRTIMGPGRLGIMQIIFEWIRQGRNVPVLGKGDNRYQFIQADDLAEACIKAAERKGPAVYNIGAEKFGTMRETLEGLIAHAGTKSRVVSLPEGPAVSLMKLTSLLRLSPLGPYHSLMYGKSMYFDLSRAKQELQWAPRYGNVEMFCQAYDWYVANRERVLEGPGVSSHRSAARQGVLALVSWILSLG